MEKGKCLERTILFGVIMAICTFFTVELNAQLLTPLSRELNLRIEYYMNSTELMPFTVWKPFYDSQLTGNAREDSLNLFDNVLSNRKGLVIRKIFRESFIQIDSEQFSLYADPLFDFELGAEKSGRKTWMNERGFRGGGTLGENFAFGTSLFETQAEFNSSLDQHISKTNLVLGQGIGRDTMVTGGIIPVHKVIYRHHLLKE